MIRLDRKVAILALAMLAASCAAQEKSADTAQSPAAESVDSIASGDAEKAEEMDEDRADGPADGKLQAQKPTGIASLVKRNQAFAFDLHRALPNENQVYSPHSISRTMGPVFAGAGGETANQIGQVLHFNNSEENLHEIFARLDTELNRREKAESVQQTAFRFKVTNHVWAAPDFKFSTNYLRRIEGDYQVAPKLVNFADSAKTLAEINGAISDATAGKIPKLLSPQHVNAQTRLILTNAVYFNAPWETPFPKASTASATFKVNAKESVPVQMMQNTAEFKYSNESNFEILEMPYLGDEVAALIVLPADGKYQDVDRSLSPDRLKWLQGRMVSQRVNVQLPKFKIRSQIGLKPTLNGMGIVDAFDAKNADFRPMIEGARDEVYLSDVVHEAFINVDEAGTEAAAATAAVMTRKGMPQPPQAKFVADRPFTFVIVDKPTGEILFIARVLRPA